MKKFLLTKNYQNFCKRYKGTLDKLKTQPNSKFQKEDFILPFTKDLRILPKISIAAKEMGIFNPTKVQKSTIPKILRNQHVVVSDKTGTGKTACYAMPILHNIHVSLIEDSKSDKEIVDKMEISPKALILIPTRDLGSQISKHFEDLSKYLGSKADELPILSEEIDLNKEKKIDKTIPYEKIEILNASDDKIRKKERTDIMVCTPGRMIHLLEKNLISTHQIKYFVLDECDKMLSLGFAEDLLKIWEQLPRPKKNRKQKVNLITNQVVIQNLLFSATIIPQIEEIVKRIAPSAAIIDLNKDKSTPTKIKHISYHLLSRQKKSLLTYLLNRKVFFS